jgi:hypothetical protein
MERLLDVGGLCENSKRGVAALRCHVILLSNNCQRACAQSVADARAPPGASNCRFKSIADWQQDVAQH